MTNLLVGVHAGEAARVAGLAALGADVADLAAGALVSVRTAARNGRRSSGDTYRLAKFPGLGLSAIVMDCAVDCYWN